MTDLPVTAFGWMHRPEKDFPHAIAWEAPSGALIYVAHGQELRVRHGPGWTETTVRKAEGGA